MTRVPQPRSGDGAGRDRRERQVEHEQVLFGGCRWGGSLRICDQFEVPAGVGPATITRSCPSWPSAGVLQSTCKPSPWTQNRSVAGRSRQGRAMRRWLSGPRGTSTYCSPPTTDPAPNRGSDAGRPNQRRGDRERPAEVRPAGTHARSPARSPAATAVSSGSRFLQLGVRSRSRQGRSFTREPSHALEVAPDRRPELVLLHPKGGLAAAPTGRAP